MPYETSGNFRNRVVSRTSVSGCDSAKIGPSSACLARSLRNRDPAFLHGAQRPGCGAWPAAITHFAAYHPCRWGIRIRGRFSVPGQCHMCLQQPQSWTLGGAWGGACRLALRGKTAMRPASLAFGPCDSVREPL